MGAGRSLLGKEAERLAELGRRVAEEQQLFLKSMWTVPSDAHITYSYIDPRADAQLKVEELIDSKYHPCTLLYCLLMPSVQCVLRSCALTVSTYQNRQSAHFCCHG